MNTEQEIKMNVVSSAFESYAEKYDEYKPVALAYQHAMNTSSGYEAVPDYKMKPGEVLNGDMIIAGFASGEVTEKGLKRAVELGKIRKITAVKPDELVTLEAELTSAHNEYIRACNDAVAAFQFMKVKGTRTRSASVDSDGVGENKKQNVTAAIHRIDSGAIVNFAGRRVFGTLSTGAAFDYDVYGQSYLESIAKMV